MKLKYYYKVDHNKLPIPGSNVRRKSSPGKQWREITPICCGAAPVEATGGFRFFLALDHNNKPIDGSLIKRKGYPEMDRKIKYQEINWKSECCTTPTGDITWEFQGFTDGDMIITVAGEEAVNVSASNTGTIAVPIGSEVTISLNNITPGGPRSIIDITGGHDYYSNTLTRTPTYTFTYDGSAVNILCRVAELAE